MSAIAIRRAGVDDAAALGELARRTFVDAFGAMNDPDDLALYVAKSYGEAQQRAEIEDPRVATFVADDGGALAGYVQVRRHDDEAELARLYVERHHHGTGVAARLLDAALDAARAFGAASIRLSVWQRNPRGIAFYRKWGFEIEGTLPFVVGNDVQTDWLMRRTL